MAKGDVIKVRYSVGDASESITIEARQNGRKVELEQSTKEITVREVTRGGTTVRRVWFPASAVLCVDSEVRDSE